MVQLPSSNKVRMDPAAAMIPQSASAEAVKLEVEDSLEEEHGPFHKRSKLAATSSANTSSTPTPQDPYCNVLDEPSPLGLRLKKSPSLLDLIQMKLSQANSSTGSCAVDNASSKAQKKELKSATSGAGERLKASNFLGTVLKIGSWEYVSRYEGDLVAKCYFAKHKLVWEVLESGLKSKIEIQWSDIAALKATCPENGHGVFDVVLTRPPLFFKETDPQPRKHTLWQATSDFTGGQASMSRRHTLQCPSVLLSKNYEKLLQCDQRLNQLSQQPDIILESSVFEPRCSIFEDPIETKCHVYNNLKNDGETSLAHFNDHASPCAALSMSTKNEAHNPIAKPPEYSFNSGSGVVDAPAVRENFISGGAQEFKTPSWWNQLKVPGLRSSMSVHDLVSHLGNCINEQMTSGSQAIPSNEVPTKEMLEEIAQYLLSDSQMPSTSDEKYLMQRVDSLCCLIEKDSTPVSARMIQPNNSDSIGDDDSDDSEVECSSTSARTFADPAQRPPMLRKDSFGELLMNLPRIASLPQFMYNIPEGSENSG